MTVAEYFQSLYVKDWKYAKEWPPDAFALMASLLWQTGAYSHIVMKWPPRGMSKWAQGVSLERDAKAWRKYAMLVNGEFRDQQPKIPKRLEKWFNEIQQNISLDIHEAMCEEKFRNAVICICCLADESCKTVSKFLPAEKIRDFLPKVNQYDIAFFDYAKDCLVGTKPHSLCRDCRGSIVRVFPKSRIPQTGLTLRSLSHNLALSLYDEVNIEWMFSPTSTNHDLNNTTHNLLLVPWPFDVNPESYSEVTNDKNPLSEMPPHYSLFEYRPCNDTGKLVDFLHKLLKQAKCKRYRVDIVVFPEGALSGDDIEIVLPIIYNYYPFAVVITGVISKADKKSTLHKNTANAYFRWNYDEANGKDENVLLLTYVEQK